MIPARQKADPLASWLALLDVTRFRIADWIFFLGVFQVLFYLPSGILHVYLGNLVYTRDLLVMVNNALLIWFLFYRQNRHVPLSYVIPLALLVVAILPGAFEGVERRNFMLIGKWIAIWSFCILFGFHTLMNMTRRHTVLFFGIIMVYLSVDSLVGFAESKRIFLYNRYILSEESTAFGRSVVGNRQLTASWLRLNGLERGAFDFASTMALGWTLSWVAVVQIKFTNFKTTLLRLMFCALGLWFAYMCILSGGRSGLVGIGTLAPLVVMTLFGWHRNSLLMRGYMVFLWVAMFLLMFVDFPALIGTIAMLLFGDLPIASIHSTIERIYWWGLLFDDFQRHPSILVNGYLWTQVFTDYVSFIRVWDNQALWMLFYGGIPVYFSFHLLFISSIPRLPKLPEGRKVPAFYYAYIVLLAYQFGESFPREALLLPTNYALLFTLGMNLALQEQLRRNPRLAPMILGLIPQMPPPRPQGWGPGGPEDSWGAPRPPSQSPGRRPAQAPGLRPPLPR
ncbi:MAG: hypothetical protein E1N59_3076 [Puniceicoccaceae bacterium 5H]|nr:MAG: hypothetical protein E1N59_3076 [Puniceicoccaceae bacterium 5H]